MHICELVPNPTSIPRLLWLQMHRDNPSCTFRHWITRVGTRAINNAITVHQHASQRLKAASSLTSSLINSNSGGSTVGSLELKSPGYVYQLDFDSDADP